MERKCMVCGMALPKGAYCWEHPLAPVKVECPHGNTLCTPSMPCTLCQSDTVAMTPDASKAYTDWLARMRG